MVWIVDIAKEIAASSNMEHWSIFTKTSGHTVLDALAKHMSKREARTHRYLSLFYTGSFEGDVTFLLREDVSLDDVLPEEECPYLLVYGKKRHILQVVKGDAYGT